MKAQASYHLKIIHGLLAIASVFVLVWFQSCGIVIPEKKEGVGKSSGNGDPYTGVVAEAGTYYYIVDDDYLCPGGLVLENQNVAKVLRIEDGLEVVELTDLCTDEVISLPRSAFRVSTFNSRLIGLAELTFQQLDEGALIRAELETAVAKCFDKSPTRREIFVFQAVTSGDYYADIYEAGANARRRVRLTQESSDVNQLSFVDQDGEFRLLMSRDQVNSDTTLVSSVYDTNSVQSRSSTSQPTSTTDVTISCYLDR